MRQQPRIELFGSWAIITIPAAKYNRFGQIAPENRFLRRLYFAGLSRYNADIGYSYDFISQRRLLYETGSDAGPAQPEI
jgi:hypothetical protein